MHIKHLKLDTRLMIYDNVGNDVNLTSFQWLPLDIKETCDSKESYHRMCFSASVMGDLEALQYIHDLPKYRPLRGDDVLNKDSKIIEGVGFLLAANGYWKSLKWLIQKKQQDPSLKSHVLTGAVFGRADIVLLRWLYSEGYKGDEITFKISAERGDWNIIKWLREINCPWDKRTFIAAADKCSLDILRWLKTENCPWDEQVFHTAAKRGDFKILVWLRLKACPWNSDTFTYAVEGGADLATLEWLYYEKCPLASTTFIAAIKRGDMEILEWLRLLRCPMSSLNFTEAIEYNVNIRMLKWMRGVGCLWDQSAFAAAVKRGDLEILQWLREEHCPWGAECFVIALENKYIEVIRWLNQVQCPFDQKSHELFVQEFVRLSTTELGYD